MIATETETWLASIPLIIGGLASLVAAVSSLVAAFRTRELKANGGSSMKDQVEKLHRVVVSTDRADDVPPATVTIDKKGTNV